MYPGLGHITFIKDPNRRLTPGLLVTGSSTCLTIVFKFEFVCTANVHTPATRSRRPRTRSLSLRDSAAFVYAEIIMPASGHWQWADSEPVVVLRLGLRLRVENPRAGGRPALRLGLAGVKMPWHSLRLRLRVPGHPMPGPGLLVT